MFKTLLLLTVVVGLWSVIVRPILRKYSWSKPFFDLPVVDFIERHLYRKSETLAWSRWIGALGPLLITVSQLDPSLIQGIAGVLPENLRWIAPATPLLLTVLGIMGEAMRRDTTKPLEVVSAPAGPVAREANAAVEASNAEAIATVQQAS